MTDVISPPARSGVAAVELLMRPKSVAVIGVSAKPGTAGRTVLSNLLLNNFPGDIHIVGRSTEDIDGQKVLQSVDDLPEGVDLAIFALPAAGVKAALEACARRKVRAVTIFSSGFAEVGERAAQDELVKIARDGGISMLGPNCLGYGNMVDGLAVGFANARKVTRLSPDRVDPALAMVSQSGGLMAYVSTDLATRNLPMAYTISTGNEAGIGFADFIDFLAEDQVVSTIIVYLEEVRDPQAFLAAARKARARGKAVLMIHPGRGAKAREAVQSHTGALAGDYDTMRVHLAHAGVVLVDTMEELVDATELVARYPEPPSKGPGIITFSGGFCAIAHDFCEDLGLDVPNLSPETVATLTPVLPAFIPPKNPLDLGTQVIWQPELCGAGAEALMKDDALGSVIIALNGGSPATQMTYGTYFVDALKTKTKPAIYSMPGADLSPEFAALIRDNRIVFSRSNERSMRAMAKVTAYGQALERTKRATKAEPFNGLPKLGHGPQPEWLGKQLLAAIGVKIPDGGLARTVDEAVGMASHIGYPVALKAQSGALAHKTEAGGVILNIKDADALKTAWTTLYDNVAKAQPGLTLDGVLVERMAAKGLELVIGAKRDPKWGPVVLVGLGGIWVEALGDVRLLPADLSEEDIVAELWKLRTAKLLGGFRGSPPVDVEAVARTVALVGRLMLTVPEITEIDINPIFAHAAGEGITAVDALIVTG